jgi:hypothetical protein
MAGTRPRRAVVVVTVVAVLAELRAGSAAAFASGSSAGQLYAFGLNVAGQLGITTNRDTGNANPMPALVSLPGGRAAG